MSKGPGKDEAKGDLFRKLTMHKVHVWVRCGAASLSGMNGKGGRGRDGWGSGGCAATTQSGWHFSQTLRCYFLSQPGLAYRKQMEVIKHRVGWIPLSQWVPSDLTYSRPCRDLWVLTLGRPRWARWPAGAGSQSGRSSSQGFGVVYGWTAEGLKRRVAWWEMWMYCNSGLYCSIYSLARILNHHVLFCAMIGCKQRCERVKTIVVLVQM